jgi:hypothetical protein
LALAMPLAMMPLAIDWPLAIIHYCLALARAGTGSTARSRSP